MRPRYLSTVRRDVVNNITDLTENGDERSWRRIIRSPRFFNRSGFDSHSEDIYGNT
jgi:hypothetical protein